MKKKLSHTKVTVKLRRSEYRDEWYLYLESYPVIEPGKEKPIRVTEGLNKSITTPVWDKKTTTRYTDTLNTYKVKRDENGIIMCKSDIDREACVYADRVRKLRQQEYDNKALFSDVEAEMAEQQEMMNQDFFAFIDEHLATIRQHGTQANLDHYSRMFHILKEYCGTEQLRFSDISMKLCNGFRNHLIGLPCAGNKKGTISQNTSSSYFAVFKAILKKAFVEGFLNVDISAKLEAIPGIEGHREHLTIEEVNMLANTDCDNPIIKRAALFSILTGLRHVDIKQLKWKNVMADSEHYSVRLRQQKTKGIVDMPISEQAFLLCGERGSEDDLVFDGLPDPSWINRPVRIWVKKAGITKHITFHCFRHTYATLQLSAGTDFYTVSKMLGHRNVRTTQIYAHMTDEQKKKASETIFIKDLDQSSIDDSK